MKQIVSNYSYSPTTNVVTLTGVNIEQDQLLLVVAPQVGRTMYNFASGVTGVVSAGADTRVTLNASTAGLTTTSPLVIFYDDHASTQTIAGTVTANGGNFLNADNALITKDSATNVILLGGLAYSTTPTLSAIQALRTQGAGTLRVYQEETNWTDTNQGDQPRRASQQTPFPVQVLGGSVTVGNSVTIGSISGVVLPRWEDDNQGGNQRTVKQSTPFPVRIYGDASSTSVTFGATIANSVTIGSLPAISGTVTARLQDASGNNLTSTSIGGLQRLNVSLASAATPGGTLPTFVNVYGGSDGSAVRTISVDSSGRQNINAQFPRVTLIDGSGTVATANTAITVFASSSTRSYLLVQVTTGSAFVNVGATATTVNGINLTAGQGYSWETTIPQGIVSLISTTTSSRYVAKEA